MHSLDMDPQHPKRKETLQFRCVAVRSALHHNPASISHASTHDDVLASSILAGVGHVTITLVLQGPNP